MNAFRKMLVRRRGLWNCLLLLAALYLAKGAIELLETTTTKTGQRHHEKKDPLSQENPPRPHPRHHSDELTILDNCEVGGDLLAPKSNFSEYTEQEIRELEEELPNVPFRYLMEHGGRRLHPAHTARSCWTIPKPWLLAFTNRNWQVVESAADGGEEEQVRQVLYFYSAYYDDREVGEKGHPSVRLLVMTDSNKHKVNIRNLRCLLWYDNATVEQTEVYEATRMHFYGGRPDVSFLLSCAVTRRHPHRRHLQQVPLAVSVVTVPDRPNKFCWLIRNFLRVRYELPEDGVVKTVAVCTRGMMFRDPSITYRIVEWLELLSILGADKVFMYLYGLPREIMRTLKYYENRGLVTLTKWSMSGHAPSSDSPLHMLMWNNFFVQTSHDRVIYTDCFYRNMYKFKYIAIFDLDEVFVPLGNFTSWKSMLEHLEKKSSNITTSFHLRNTYFMDDMLTREDYESGDYDHSVPAHMHILRHVVRSTRRPRTLFKSIIRSSQGKTMYSHYPTSCLRGYCHAITADPASVAYMAHYRKTCQKAVPECANYLGETVRDESVLRFKDRLVERVNRALDDLQLPR